MAERQFASWIAPIARRDGDARIALVAYARSVPGDAWDQPSALDGWSCKDILAHLAGDTGKWFAYILDTALNGSALDGGRAGPGADIDAINARDVRERHGRSVSELIAEIESDGAGHLERLSRLTERHSDVRLEPYAYSLAGFLGGREAGNRGAHDREHLAHLRSALDMR